ncbi:methylenetetrahydrofolate reductase [Corynebacterium phocae]|uniref:Methylenetetrahydrofolate reductase n=1 Tax=Corynebacterium phocae TaxID=161895 RepID=A0A1L7D0E7_9CORY|nr:methylenetetrahydrofolate reductase [Corynebacterium phocae]APT91598.1 methylenetetrahydrofolate reductase [Corynebacterium phocae]KAA8720667.1 methylenetetrahydrofolate reductase [Corynebacterium phocae]
MTPRLSASVPLDYFDAQPTVPLQRTALSFEVIPPRHDADAAKVDRLIDTLAAYNPDYIAVTSSKRSGWLEGTAAFIEKISQRTTMRPLAHLACTAGNPQELTYWINRLVDSGVRGLLALRGDLPAEGMPAGYLPHATDLINLIRDVERGQAARFAAGRLAVGVACYPCGHEESASPDEDFDVLLAKQRLGADLAISQLFFDAEDFLRFKQRAQLAGVRMPLIPGIMPFSTPAKLERMAKFSGLPTPVHLLERLGNDPDSGLELTAQLARTCLGGGAGALHIYTHNNPDLTVNLLNRIGIAQP